ncbi:MAG: hypothetical protein AAF203_07005 [Pseudomonadota bacterium]
MIFKLFSDFQYEVILAKPFEWANLNFEERYILLESAFLLNNEKKFSKLLEQADLSDPQLQKLFILKAKADNCANPESLICDFMTFYPDFSNSPFLLAELFFQMGWISQQAESHTIAQSYFTESEALYRSLDLAGLTWRSRMNVVVSQLHSKKLQGEKAQKKLKQLEEELFDLTSSQRKYLYRIMCHTLNFIGDTVWIENLLREATADFSSTSSSTFEFQQFLFNKIYVLFKNGHSSAKIEKEVGQTSLKGYSQELYNIITSPTPDDPHLWQAQARFWIDSFHGLEVEYLLDVFLTKTIIHLNPDVSLPLIQDLLPHLKRKPQAPIFRPLLFEIQLAAESHNFIDWEKFSQALSNKLPNVETKLTRSVKQRKGFKNKVVMIFEDSARVIKVDHRTIDLREKEKIYDLIWILANSENDVHAVDLFSKIYGYAPSSSSDDQKLNSLVQRARRISHLPTILRRDNRYSIPNIEIQLKTTQTSRTRRHQLILDYIKNRGLPCSIGEIEKELLIKRRTLQEDLQSLSLSGSLKRMGQGRGTRYQAE